MRLGLDSFTFHRWFGEVNQWESPVGERWQLPDLFRSLDQLDLETLSLQTIHLLPSDRATLAWLKGELEARDLVCILAWGHRNGLEDGRSPQKLAAALAAMRDASALGCRVFRVVCGDLNSWNDDPRARSARNEQLRLPIAAIAAEAERLELLVAIENHADCKIADLVWLIEAVGSERLGICFDLGNAVRVGEDPIAAARAAAPWMLMTHLRDLKIQSSSLGDPAAYWPCVPLGQGDLDIPAVLAELALALSCQDWLVEASNVLAGHDEHELVVESLAYLRSWAATANRES